MQVSFEDKMQNSNQKFKLERIIRNVVIKNNKTTH